MGFPIRPSTERVCLFRHLGTNASGRVRMRGRDHSTGRCPASRSALLEEIEQAEGDEEDRQDDREAEERALDPAPAAVGGHLAAERAAEAGPALLEQDGGHQRHGQDHLGNEQRGLHDRRSLAGSCRGTLAYIPIYAVRGYCGPSRLWPVISGPKGMASSSHSVGATSRSSPSCSVRPRYASLTSTTGTGDVVCLVCGDPDGSRISSALP